MDSVHYMKYIMRVRPTFFTNVRTQDYRTFKKLFDFIRENNVHYFAVKNLDYAARLSSMYDKLSKEYDPIIVSGLFRYTYSEDSPSKIEKTFRKEIAEMEKDVNEKLDLFKSYTNDSVSIEVIRSKYDLVKIEKETKSFLATNMWKIKEGEKVVLKLIINEKIVVCVVNLTKNNTYSIDSFIFKEENKNNSLKSSDDDIIPGESVLSPMSIDDFVLMMENVTSLKYEEKDTWPENNRPRMTEEEVDELPF